MISVLPGQTFTFKNPNTKEDLDRIISEVVKAIRSANPFVDTIEFLNQTKYCSLDIEFKGTKLQVIFKNPRDEQFDLNELENPVTPLTISGR